MNIHRRVVLDWQNIDIIIFWVGRTQILVMMKMIRLRLPLFQSLNHNFLSFFHLYGGVIWRFLKRWGTWFSFSIGRHLSTFFFYPKYRYLWSCYSIEWNVLQVKHISNMKHRGCNVQIVNLNTLYLGWVLLLLWVVLKIQLLRWGKR